MSVAGSLHVRLDRRRDRRRLTRGQQFREVNHLLKQENETWAAKRGPEALIELPTPVRAGWERYFFVRPDVLKSPEGPTLEKLLVLLQNVQTSRRKDFATRDWRRGNKLRPKVHYLRRISEKEFRSLSEKQQRYFAYYAIKRKTYSGSWIEHTYEFKFPWKYVSRTRPYYITHRALPNSEADSRSSFLCKKLWGPDYMYRHFARYVGDSYKRWDRGEDSLFRDGISVTEELAIGEEY